jgi:anhydro-N-acetylmuramic acid kinase
LHDPEHHLTRQIGQGALLARATGIDVVDDFRSSDVAAGGQGAPLAPLAHLALAVDLERPLAVLNLGGVGNATWIGLGDDGSAESSLMGFDTGPGNAMIDDWVLARTGQAMDKDGTLAASGKVHEALVTELLEHPYFRMMPPKSIDRNLFDASPLEHLSVEDGAATLCALTVRTVAMGANYFTAPVKNWLVSGGGRKNPVLMAMLADALAVEVKPVEAVGWDGDMLEAQAFAYLAVRSLRQLPITFPGTTGVPEALTGGALHRAQAD